MEGWLQLPETQNSYHKPALLTVKGFAQDEEFPLPPLYVNAADPYNNAAATLQKRGHQWDMWGRVLASHRTSLIPGAKAALWTARSVFPALCRDEHS